MSRQSSTETSSHLAGTHALLNQVVIEFVEIRLDNSPQRKNRQPTPSEDRLDFDDTIFQDELNDQREVASANYSPFQKSTLLNGGRKRRNKPCLPRNYCIGTASLIPILIQKISLSYAFWMTGEGWTYGVASGLLLLSLIHDFLIASAPVHKLLTKPSPNINVLYEDSKTPKLPAQEGTYGMAQLIFSGFGILSTAVLWGYAETKVASAHINSSLFEIAFCVVAAIARIVDRLEANSVATLSCYLLASETARAPVFVSAMADWGAKITFYRDYLTLLKGPVSALVCCLLMTSITFPGEFLAGTLLGGSVVFLGMLALMGDNYRTNRLNIKKEGLKPKHKCDQIGRQILNIAIPYQLAEGITSIYRSTLTGHQKIMHAIPALVLALAVTSSILSLMQNTHTYLTENISLNALLLGLSMTMGCLALLSFIRTRYESAVALVGCSAYDPLLSAYWILQLTQHPTAQPILDNITFSSETKDAVIFITSFTAFLLTTSHTKYFIDQIIANKILFKKKATPLLQMRTVSHSFDSPPSWRKSLFKQRSGSDSKAITFGTTAKKLVFATGNPFDADSDEETACTNPFGEDSGEEKTTALAHPLNPFG